MKTLAYILSETAERMARISPKIDAVLMNLCFALVVLLLVIQLIRVW